jgi:hypothetical protein
MTPQKLCVSQAFPIYPWQVATACGITLAEAERLPVCSVSVDRSVKSLPARKRRSLASMAGNSMNCNVVAAANIWALAFAQRQDMSFLPPFASLQLRPKGAHAAVLDS